jgi:1-acyl-sn-glycerol-3-phosphate acyltransferase
MAYWVLKILLTPVLRLVFRVRTEGTQHVPRQGPAILASNHRSFIDSIFLPLVVRRRVTFVAKAEYFESWKTAWFFRAVGMIPLKRGDGSASERALVAAREVLGNGGILGIYPEGTRSPDGRLYKGHTGAARLARDCNAPIVPVAQFGTDEVQPIGCMWPKLFRQVKLKMGPPLWWKEGAGGLRQLRDFTDEVMAAIAAQSGQQMVGEYANRDRGRLSAPGSEAHPVPAQA